MKIIQAILSAFCLLTVVHAAVEPGAAVNLGGAGGGGGGKAAVGVLGDVTVTPPAPPNVVSFPPEFSGIGNIFKTIPVDTANIAAITGALETLSVIINSIITSVAVNTPIASETVDVWVITTVSAFVTICPSPTTFVQGVQTYTIIEATTLIITNCPCTISYPAPTTVATTPPSIASVPVPIGTGLPTPSGGSIIITNCTSIPSIASANPPAPLSFNSTRTTFIAVTAPPPHATQPLITLGGFTTIIPTPVSETPTPVASTPVPVLPTPTPATGGADRIFIGLGAAFLSGLIAVFL